MFNPFHNSHNQGYNHNGESHNGYYDNHSGVGHNGYYDGHNNNSYGSTPHVPGLGYGATTHIPGMGGFGSAHIPGTGYSTGYGSGHSHGGGFMNHGNGYAKNKIHRHHRRYDDGHSSGSDSD